MTTLDYQVWKDTKLTALLAKKEERLGQLMLKFERAQASKRSPGGKGYLRPPLPIDQVKKPHQLSALAVWILDLIQREGAKTALRLAEIYGCHLRDTASTLAALAGKSLVTKHEDKSYSITAYGAERLAA